MAVQAQYPSNVLLFNRNVQDGHQDYSLQPHPGGIFGDQPHALINNGGLANQRKRGRGEYCGGIKDNNIAGPSSSSMQAYIVPPQPPQQPPQQLIDLSQLHNNSVSTGLRLAFITDQQQHQKQNQKVGGDSSANLFMFKQDLAAQMRQHSAEIDQFIHAQGEQLRRTLAEKRQRHLHALLGAAEDAVARRLREKEAEVEKARSRNADLQARADQLGTESQLWQAKARSQEAAAASLRAHLQQAMMGGGKKLDATVSEGQAADDAESVYVDPDRTSTAEPSCKGCRKRPATVLLLPCRHLSLCTDCGRVAYTCPLCSCATSSVIEVYLP